MKRILVTGCGGPLGVNVTRSLKKSSSVWVLGTDANRYHILMSLADHSELIPLAKKTPEYLAALRELIARHDIDMILPTHPVEVRTISQNRDSLPGVRLFLPGSEAILKADSKWDTYQLLLAAGVPVPRTFLIQSPADLAAVFAEIETRPVWVRGSGAPGIGIGVASLPCRTTEHAVAWVDHHQGWGGFIASEYLPGRNLTWCGIFHQSRLVAAQCRERLEYVLPHVSPSGITGAPAVSRTITRKDLHQVGEASVRALPGDPSGIYFVDFKEDAAEVPRVTEINAGRFGTTIHFYSEAGCNFPLLALELAFGEDVPGPPLLDPIPPNWYWIRTLDCGPVLVHLDS
jgi:biotin carboxylase